MSVWFPAAKCTIWLYTLYTCLSPPYFSIPAMVVIPWQSGGSRAGGLKGGGWILVSHPAHGSELFPPLKPTCESALPGHRDPAPLGLKLLPPTMELLRMSCTALSSGGGREKCPTCDTCLTPQWPSKWEMCDILIFKLLSKGQLALMCRQ